MADVTVDNYIVVRISRIAKDTANIDGYQLVDSNTVTSLETAFTAYFGNIYSLFYSNSTTTVEATIL
jgi:hypothetical protein